MLKAVPPAIANSGVAAGNNDSSYLLALLQVVETLSDRGGEQLVVDFSQVLTTQLALPNDPLQRAALARAAVPLLKGQGGSPPALVASVAGVTLVPEVGVDLDPAQRSRLRQAAVADAEDALRQALAAPDGAQREGQSEAALRLLQAAWSTEPTPTTRSNPYRRAAQVRLLEVLAPSLTEQSAVLAGADLLAMLPDTADYLTRAAIARAFAALAVADKLPDTSRGEALAAAKVGLAKTGSSEEATAWAGAIAALLPHEPRAATAEIVAALKYPTATEAPTDVLLAALATPWPEEHKTIAGRTLRDQIVLAWLEAHLPEGYNLTKPPTPPPGL
ncbi:MAG: hypothetical protein ACREJ0_08425, partial [Geminicoccaceae bacterium]